MTAVRGARKQAAPAPAAPAPAAPAAPAKKPNIKMIAAAGGVVLLLAAFMLTRGGGGTPAAAPPVTGPAVTAGTGTATAALPEQHGGPVVSLPSITINLADGKFLRLGVALQLPDAATVPAEAAADPKNFGARALDSAIEVMSSYASPDLSTAEGRAAAKEKLSETVVNRYGGEVAGIYLTDFVMQ